MLTRRKFLAWTAATLGGAALFLANRLFGTPTTLAQSPQPTRAYFLPVIAHGSRMGAIPRVVHIYSGSATFWNGSGYFFDAVNQTAVDAMVLNGLQKLTGETSWQAIWSALFSRVRPGGYQPGQKIVIKINLNNCRTCVPHGNAIDALPHPLISLISGMAAAGIQPADIIIYDAIRAVPSYLHNPIHALYPSVQFLGTLGCSGGSAPGFGKDASLTIPFNDANHYLQPRHLADVLYDATYLINMPILKSHSGEAGIPVTLTFKGHFGSIDRISGDGNDNLHSYVSVSTWLYQTTYSPLVDIYSNPNIKNKAILTMGDGLFGGFGASATAAVSWNVFGGGAKSLFFATDPVAIDCVMTDFLVAENRVTKAHAYDHLFCAESAGLGTCEGTRSNPGGNPLQLPYGSGYASIAYRRTDI